MRALQASHTIFTTHIKKHPMHKILTISQTRKRLSDRFFRLTLILFQAIAKQIQNAICQKTAHQTL